MKNKVLKLYDNTTYHEEENTEYYENYYNHAKYFELYSNENTMSDLEEEIQAIDVFDDEEAINLTRQAQPRNTVRIKAVFKPKRPSNDTPLSNDFSKMTLIKKFESKNKLKNIAVPTTAAMQNKEEIKYETSSPSNTENSQKDSTQKKQQDLPIFKKLTPRFNANNKYDNNI